MCVFIFMGYKRKYGRSKRKYTRYKRKYKAVKRARRARNRTIRNVVNRMAETKYVEGKLFDDQTGLDAGGTALGAQVRAMYSAIGVGTSNHDRIGSKIRVKGVLLSIYVDWKDTFGTGYPNDFAGRLVIVNWKSGRTRADLVTDNIPTVGEIIEYAGSDCIYSPFVRKDKGRDRFEVLYDKLFINNSPVVTGTGSVSVSNQKVMYRKYIPINKDVWFYGLISNTDIAKNQLYAVWVSDNPSQFNNGCSLTMYVRTTYSDI